MKILESSAEFEINSNFMNTLFGMPHYFQSGHFVTGTAAYNFAKEISRPLAKEDIGKLNTWEENVKEISELYNPASTSIWVDKYNCYWVGIGGTGWACMWSVGLGSLESGKYPVYPNKL